VQANVLIAYAKYVSADLRTLLSIEGKGLRHLMQKNVRLLVH